MATAGGEEDDHVADALLAFGIADAQDHEVRRQSRDALIRRVTSRRGSETVPVALVAVLVLIGFGMMVLLLTIAGAI